MKKFLVIFLILAVAGGVFAQELKFTGEARSGISVIASDGEDSTGEALKTQIGLWSPPAEFGARAQLHIAYTNADATAGAYITFRSVLANGWTGNTLWTIPNARAGFNTFANLGYAWLSALDKKVTFYGGKMDNAGVFGLGLALDTTLDLAGGTGLYTRIEPAANLTLGVGIFPTQSSGAGSTTKDLNDGAYRFGVAYAIPNTATIVGILAMNGQYDKATYEEATKVNAYVGAKITALSGMGLSVLGLDFLINDLTGEKKDEGIGITQLRIGEKVTYAAGDLEAGIRFAQGLLIGKDATKDFDDYSPDMTFGLYGQYKLNGGKIIPRLDVVYNIGTTRYLNGDAVDSTKYAGVPRAGSATYDGVRKFAAADTESFNKNYANLGISPSVEFRVGGSSSQAFQIGYALYNDMSKFNDKSLSDLKLKSLEHVLYLDYKVSF